MATKKIIARFAPIVRGLWLILVFIAIIWKGIIPGWQDKPADFNNYYVSAKLVSEGLPIHQFYDNDWFNYKAKETGIKEGAKFSPFPPITAYAYLPLTFFEALTAKKIWLVFNILILCILPFRIRKITKWSLTQALLFLSLFFIPISSCLNSGQAYLLIGFVLMESFGQLYTRSKPRLLGLVIGVLASLKYLPILFLGYVLNNKKVYRVLLYVFLGIAIPFLIVFVIDGQAYRAFFQHFLSHIQGNLPGQGEYAIGFQSIDSLLNNLFVYNELKNPFPLLDSPILKPIIKYALFGVIIGLLLVVFKKNRYQITPAIISISIVGAFVMIPASASYHFLLLLWPILCLIKWLVSFKSKQALIIVSLLIFISFTIQQHHIPNFNQFPIVNLLLHYPRFWSLLCVFLVLNFYYIKALNKNYG